MADISKIKVGETEYDVKDATARTAIANFKSSDITYGYEDLVDGVSPLDPGAVYFYIAPTGPYRWYLVDGITEENVVAAYRFKGAETQAEALLNVNENGDYPLSITGTVTWTTGEGLYFPAVVDCYITNDTLTALQTNIKTCAFKFAGMSTGSLSTAGTTLYIGAETNSKYLIAKYGGYYSNSASSNYANHCISQSASTRNYKQTATVNTEGVLSCDWVNYALWYNGISQSMTNATNGNADDPTDNTSWTTGRIFTTASNNSLYKGVIYLESIVFFNCVLTGEQHLQLATQINAL